MDSGMNGGRPDHMAPVIPLFGDRNGPEDSDAQASGGGVAAGRATVQDPAERAIAGRTFVEEAESSQSPEPVWHQTWLDAPLDDLDDLDAPLDDLDEDRASLLHDAEQSLLKRLRTRSLSVREARTVLVQAGLDHAEADRLTDRFVRDRYLDDAALAEQLVHKATGRKGQGSQAIALSLTRRGISREVIDAALAELPDEDADRALEFARAKAKGMADLDRDVALRRLAGQLARRGYGSAALSAARRALDELPAARRAVRFE